MLPTTGDRRSKHLLLKICYWRSEIIRYCRLFSSLSVGRRIQIFKMECWIRILENETLWKPACPERHRPERHRPQNRIRSFTVVWRFWSEDSRISSASFYMGPCQESKPRKIKVFSRDGCRPPQDIIPLWMISLEKYLLGHNPPVWTIGSEPSSGAGPLSSSGCSSN